VDWNSIACFCDRLAHGQMVIDNRRPKIEWGRHYDYGIYVIALKDFKRLLNNPQLINHRSQDYWKIRVSRYIFQPYVLNHVVIK